uniref:FBD domain-containing protein n=1 Tax=Oryza rufipogon TaxID=4529 RepID=A0A0E0QWK8_ORYRU
MFFLDKGFFKRIKTGCPALEDLLLHDCIIMDDEISFSKTLQILTSHEEVPPGLQDFYFYSLVSILKNIKGELKERSFTCENLKIVEVTCLEEDPLVNRQENFFFNSGITSLKINITFWNYN